MPRKYLMTWEKPRCRWRKLYRGTLYVVSCRELSAPPTKEDSYEKANDWWRAKQAELDGFTANPTLDPVSATVKEILDRSADPLRDLRRLTAQGDAARKVVGILEESSIKGHEGDTTPLPDGGFAVPMPNPSVTLDALARGEGLPLDVVDRVLTDGVLDELNPSSRLAHLAEVNRLIKATKPAADPDKRVETHVESWVATEMQRVRTGKLGHSRANMNRLCLHHFQDWIGKDTSVECITEAKWLEFYGWLSARLDDGTWGLEHCDRIFSVTKRFVKFLWELRLIELPRNLDKRDLSFTQHPRKIETFTVEEVQNLYRIVTGQSKLHVLLMLNCGFIGQDINDLRHDEVDWGRGIVTRKRSKTRDHENVPEVRYKLWDRTFSLLKEHRSHDPEFALLTQKGNRWITEGTSGTGKYSRSDCVGRNLDYWLERAGVERPPKALRTTASSKLGEHSSYKFYAQYFLGQSHRTVADKFYVKPNDEEFFEALGWLEGALGFVC